MVGFLQSPTIEGAAEEEKEDLKVQPLSDTKKPSIPNDPLDLGLPELEEFSLSFSDSFLDFDSINGWFMEGNPTVELSADPSMAGFGGSPVDFGSVEGELGASKESFEVGSDCKKDEGEEELGGVVERSGQMGSDGVSDKINLEGVLGWRWIGCCLQERRECRRCECDECSDGWKSGETVKVNTNSVSTSAAECTDAVGVVGLSGNGMKVDKTRSDENESDSDVESECESSSSSSSASSSSDDDEEVGEMKAKNEAGTVDKKIDMEEGEIMLSDADEIVAWSDDEDDDGGTGKKDPSHLRMSSSCDKEISISTLLIMQVLPPVPCVDVTLQPHHQTLPVGIILSIIGPQVIVEGVEKHNPLNEGSILWITESRSPLGIVDEIFGPVKNPYYIVRYNSESEVPSGIQQGTSISFVPEFANHVLNDKSLYQKGYDASGENDEELFDEVEFSDDEKEAEYKRMLKTKKRGTEESKPGAKRKDKRKLKNQNKNWSRNQDPAKQTPLGGGNVPVNEGQNVVPPVATSLNQENYSSSSALRQDLAAPQATFLPFPQRAQAPGFCPPDGIWSNGFPHQQQQSVGLVNGLPPNGMLWMQQNQPYQLYQTPLQTGMAFQQQMSTIPGLPLNFNALGGQANFSGGPAIGPWSTSLDQNMLNSLQFGMGLPPQNASLPLNGGGEQAVPPQGSQINHNLQSTPANLGKPPSFNQGRGGGRGGHHRGRGRGRFGGGRG
ncbi:UNVERIFIED_CONTAM: H/ACA ribonucleoprotein complex non-core subunit NAF1 [Sesamum calycinum]|uniref:H/ACA ribonucleoprotein complex non-core subunit NAF1 n=1 Tax=Sesamum calycinum TaxID=2727403 RepID=A0AAW2M9I4_9LAMI